MRRTARVAVIGAGLGGMTVAGLLQRRGFSVKVYEQAAAFSRIGAGIHLSSNVMLVMRHLGIEKTLSDIALHPDAFVSRQWDTGEVVFELPFDPVSEARCGVAPVLPIAMIGISACPAGSSKKMLHQLRERCKGHADGFSCSA